MSVKDVTDASTRIWDLLLRDMLYFFRGTLLGELSEWGLCCQTDALCPLGTRFGWMRRDVFVKPLPS